MESFIFIIANYLKDGFIAFYMKARLFIQLILFGLFMSGSDLMAQEYFFEQFPKVWERNMGYSKAVAEAMPAQLYDYRPTPESMSFGDQLLHIVDNISFLTAKITGKREVFYKKEEKDSLDKNAIIALLDTANSYVLKLVKEADNRQLDEKLVFGNENMTKENIFYLLRGHQVHHRAQCLVYLRLNGVTAPNYVGW